MRWLALLCALTVTVTLYACSGDDNTTTATTNHGGSTAVGGSGGGGGSVACIDGLQSLTLSPADSTVQLDGGPAADIAFTVSGSFSDGSSADVSPGTLLWDVTRVDDTDPGTIAAGVLSPNPSAGGVVTVTATDGCVSGSTTVTFFLDVTLGNPSDPNAWSNPPTMGAGSPLIVYPSDQTRFPRNIYRTLFQWRSQGYTEFRLTYDGPYSKVTVFTDGVHGMCASANPAAGCWEVDEVAWNYIAASNAGETASWVVDSLDTTTTPATVWRSDPITIGFSLQDVKGAIFYWSTTSAGVRRGRISQVNPEDYIVGKPNGTVYGNDEVGCVACHTVSRDGKYMVAPVKSDNTDSMWIMEVTQAAPPNPLVTDIMGTKGHGFGTISPDDNHVVVSYKDDHMWMVDRATGQWEADLPTQAFDGGTHPDWSPDNTQLVFASGQGDGPQDASLVLIPWNGSAWGTPTELLPPPAGQSNLFPMFSPTGDWIAFSQGSKGGHGDVTAQLWVVSKNGGTPVEMLAANRMTSNQLTDGQYQSSQPTWAPPGDYDWIAFNTKREYGVVLAEGTQQIWVAAVDTSKATNGQDPSYPAFRVPFQGLNENNHRAFWTLDVGDGGSGGSGGSGGAGGGTPCNDILTQGELCDPLNDCCEMGAYCDTADSGMTYTCVSATPN